MPASMRQKSDAHQPVRGLFGRIFRDELTGIAVGRAHRRNCTAMPIAPIHATKSLHRPCRPANQTLAPHLRVRDPASAPSHSFSGSRPVCCAMTSSAAEGFLLLLAVKTGLNAIRAKKRAQVNSTGLPGQAFCEPNYMILLNYFAKQHSCPDNFRRCSASFGAAQTVQITGYTDRRPNQETGRSAAAVRLAA